MSVKLSFHKMHSYGNDFIIIQDESLGENLTSSQIRHLCDRKLGIGCDQLLFFKYCANYVEMSIFNGDSSNVSFCGNGTRCLAALLLEKKNDFILIKTGNGIIRCEKDLISNLIRINIGKPLVESVLTSDNSELEVELIDKDNQKMITKGFCINVGNPHIVIFVKDFNFDLETSGYLIQNMAQLTEKRNVNFCQIVNKDKINLRVFEKGAGLTLACGSGACASAYVAWSKNLLNNKVSVEFPLGSIEVEIDDSHCISMTANYTYVFDGIIYV